MGQPGDRTFYLQASDSAGRTVSVALEKSQVQILADRMSELLDEVAARANTVIPPDADIDDLEPLAAPIDEEFRVAAMGLAWDGEAQAVVVEAVAAGEEPIESCTLITTEANETVGPVHDRMPVILHPEDYGRWLDPGVQKPELVQPLLRPYPSEELAAFPVSRRVNNPKNDDPACLAGGDRLLF